MAVEEEDNLLHMRFYSKNVVNNSKALGSYVVGQPNDQCNFMQTVTDLSFMKPYLKNATDDTMIVALLCGSLLKFVSFNFYPSLTLTL